MVRERDTRKVVWPSYFDIKLSRAEGRRLPKSLCIEEPDVQKLSEAIKSLKLEFEAQSDKSYPSRWWKKEGRLLVDSDMNKAKLLASIGKKLKN